MQASTQHTSYSTQCFNKHCIEPHAHAISVTSHSQRPSQSIVRPSQVSEEQGLCIVYKQSPMNHAGCHLHKAQAQRGDGGSRVSSPSFKSGHLGVRVHAAPALTSSRHISASQPPSCVYKNAQLILSAGHQPATDIVKVCQWLSKATCTRTCSIQESTGQEQTAHAKHHRHI